MKPFEYEIENLKSLTSEMMDLVRDQIHLTKEAILVSDYELSCEIISKEKRVNAFELSIERDCEDFLALHSPVAADLRLAIAVLKISASLERIGDHAFAISSFVFDETMQLTKELVEVLSLPDLFDQIDDMFTNIIEAFETGDVRFAKKVFKQDKMLDKTYRGIPKLLEDYATSNGSGLTNLILISRTIGKLERVGDLLKNIAEDIIFYYESKVVRHKKKNKHIDKKLKAAEEEG
ncbi:MAG: phosphate signaling complex protein PhoU [Bacteroidales bacterium]|nr:phosphate signaling complex protein PhoU [Bacteroidales bacterium]